MSDQPRPTRRTVLRTCGAICLGGAGTTAASGRESETTTEAQADELSAVRTGLYSGTVDRIVDGEHVVVLLEEAREQIVLAREQAPDAAEGDRIRLWLWRGTVLGIWPG